MDTISILLADDDLRIRSAIEKILYQNFSNINIVATTDSVDQTILAIKENKPQIAILDIHLNGGTALQVLKQTRDYDYKVIFMSAYQEYALDDIRFASIDFIYKPLDISELLITVDNVISTLIEEGYKKKMQTFFNNSTSLSSQKQIIFKTKTKIISVPICNIIYGESNYSQSNFYLSSEDQIKIKEPLRRYESMLDTYNFVRCHPLYIVNIKHIKQIDYNAMELLLTNNHTIPVEPRKIDYIIEQQSYQELKENTYNNFIKKR